MPVIAFGRDRTELKEELRRLEPSWFHQITLPQTWRMHRLASCCNRPVNFDTPGTISMPGCEIVLDDWRCRPHLVVSPRREYQGWFGIHLGESRLKHWAQFWTLASGAEPDDGRRQELARTSRAPTHSIEPRSLAPAEEVSAPLDVR